MIAQYGCSSSSDTGLLRSGTITTTAANPL